MLVSIALYSLIGIITLVITSYVTTFIFHILNDQFYAIFHLICGVLCTFFYYSFTQNFLVSIFLTELTGIVWEAMEWCQWKFILKNKKYKPRADDTRNDLIVDLVGSVLGVLILVFY